MLKKVSNQLAEAYNPTQLRQFVFFIAVPFIDEGEFDKATKGCNKTLEEAKSKQAQKPFPIEGLRSIATRKETAWLIDTGKTVFNHIFPWLVSINQGEGKWPWLSASGKLSFKGKYQHAPGSHLMF